MLLFVPGKMAAIHSFGMQRKEQNPTTVGVSIACARQSRYGILTHIAPAAATAWSAPIALMPRKMEGCEQKKTATDPHRMTAAR